MEDDQAYSQPGVPADDDAVYSKIVTGFAIGIAILMGVIFISVLA